MCLKNLLPEYTFRYQGVIQSLPINRIKSLAIKSGGVLLERRDGVSINVADSLVISAGPALEFVFLRTASTAARWTVRWTPCSSA